MRDWLSPNSSSVTGHLLVHSSSITALRLAHLLACSTRQTLVSTEPRTIDISEKAGHKMIIAVNASQRRSLSQIYNKPTAFWPRGMYGWPASAATSGLEFDGRNVDTNRACISSSGLGTHGSWLLGGAAPSGTAIECHRARKSRAGGQEYRYT
ncbi:hypothetical protein C8Q70DRAFT_935925 [Cubamyces menziesii]|nr:hypothetical protein C8Q70DRAFT_935925 [Cubamyces menziesii]